MDDVLEVSQVDILDADVLEQRPDLAHALVVRALAEADYQMVRIEPLTVAAKLEDAAAVDRAQNRDAEFSKAARQQRLEAASPRREAVARHDGAAVDDEC